MFIVADLQLFFNNFPQKMIKENGHSQRNARCPVTIEIYVCIRFFL